MYDVFLDGNPTHGPFLFSPPSVEAKKGVKTTTNKPRGSVVSGEYCCLHAFAGGCSRSSALSFTVKSKSLNVGLFSYVEERSSVDPPCVWIHKWFTRQTHLAVLYIAAVLLNALLHRFHLSHPFQPIATIRTNAQQLVGLHTLCKHLGTKDE